MGFSSTAIIVLSCFILVSSAATAFNITAILEKKPDYSNFNDLLLKNKLADEINRRKTITVLAVPNSAIGGISGAREEVQKSILSNHVVLDYYDEVKLSKLKSNKTTVTTLFQTSGLASQQQGFLAVRQKDGSIVFGSAEKGAPMEAKLTGLVFSQPYNISVLSISQPIVAPGIDGTVAPVSAPPPKASAPKASTKAPTPSDSTDDSESPMESDAPTPSTADAPASSDVPTKSPTEAPAADAATPPTSAAENKVVSVGSAIVLASMLALIH